MAKGIKQYRKEFGYSYCIGAFPSIELLKLRPEDVLEVITSQDSFENEGVEKLHELAKKLPIKFSQNDKLVKEISGKENAYVVTIFKKYDTQIDQREDHVVLVNPADAGNLGTIIRTALAFDVKNIAIIKPAVDPFDPKVIRSSMGAIFQINVMQFGSLEEYMQKFPRNFYFFRTDGREEVSKVNFEHPSSFVFGNEAAGLSKRVEQNFPTVRIENSKNVDSLNLSVAVGIVLHHSRVQ